MASLNGWRRLGLVFVALWFAGIVLIAITGDASGLLSSDATETRQQLVPMTPEELAERQKRESGKPWEKYAEGRSDYKMDEVQIIVSSASPLKIGIVGLLVPLVVWLLMEGVVLVALWVIAGFSAGKGKSSN
ncbi:hypothetical protein [Rivibacter subsaxonicus]|nr:hypothetical protein [Rivibacter subsaxonicus]